MSCLCSICCVVVVGVCCGDGDGGGSSGRGTAAIGLAKILLSLLTLRFELPLVYGKLRHPQSQGSVERANRDIKDMVIFRMSVNNTAQSSVGLRFVQFM